MHDLNWIMEHEPARGGSCQRDDQAGNDEGSSGEMSQRIKKQECHAAVLKGDIAIPDQRSMNEADRQKPHVATVEDLSRSHVLRQTRSRNVANGSNCRASTRTGLPGRSNATKFYGRAMAGQKAVSINLERDHKVSSETLSAEKRPGFCREPKLRGKALGTRSSRIASANP